MKKYFLLLLAAALALGALSGCTLTNADLLSAISRTENAASYVKTTTVNWSVDIAEPYSIALNPYFADYGYNDDRDLRERADMANLLADFCQKLFENYSVKSVTVKDNSVSQTDVSVFTSDMRLSFTSWTDASDEGERLLVKIPSVLYPSVYKAASGKQYFAIGSAENLKNVLCGALFDEDDKKIINSFSELIDFVSDRLTLSFMKSADITGNGGTYTLNVNTAALKALVDEAADILGSEEASELITELLEEDAGSFDPDLIKLYNAAIAEELENSGIFNNGFTEVFTVNSDGLLEKTETKIVFDIDVEALSSAVAEIMAIIEGTGADSFKAELIQKGRCTVTLGYVTDYDYVEASVSLPDANAGNTVDIVSELAEFADYTQKLNDLESEFDSFYYSDLSSGSETVTLRNYTTGAETEAVARIIDYDLYLPISELCALFDDISARWNPEAMGVDVAQTYVGPDGTEETYSLFFPNEDGRELYSDIIENWQYDENGDAKYTGEKFDPETAERLLDYYLNDSLLVRIFNTFYFDENGKMYININQFCSIEDCLCNYGDGVLSLITESERFKLIDECLAEISDDIEDNFFYIIFYGSNM